MSSDARRILIIDDNADDRADLRQMLLRGSNSRYRFTDAGLGMDGLKLTADAQCFEPNRLPFDCILLDFNLPDIDAHEVLAGLCAGNALPPCPVVVITGWNGVDSAVGGKLLRAGAQDYIGKSWTTPESITRAVENAIERFDLMRQRGVEVRALNESEQRYRSLFDSIGDCMCVLEKIEAEVDSPVDFRCVDVNPAFAAHYGLSGLIGKTLRQILPNDSDDWFNIYDRVWASGVPAYFEGRVLKDSRDFSLHAFRIGDPTTTKLVVIRNDITQRKETERELLKLAQTLRDQDSRKDEFLAMLAHELRNPLATLGYGLNILRLPRDEKKTEHVRSMMDRQVGQMVHLIEDLLDVSRISRGKIVLRKERMELAKAVRQAIEASQQSISQAEHTLSVTLPPVPIYVDADPTRMTQVFSNLLNNAAKFTNRGGQIVLTMQQSGTEVFVSIKDNGTGIEPNMLPGIFEMFTQVESNKERVKEGLGIGLSIVKTLVEMHGGSVKVQSNGLGMGSEFIVRLPVARVPAENVSTDHPELLYPTKSLRILVVDDNMHAAESLSMMLNMIGNQTMTARDGLEALEVAETFRPNVIFLDIGMPKLNGHEVGRRIRQQEWGKDTILIAITGLGTDEDKRRSLEAGLDHHLVKPVSPTVIERLLLKCAINAL
ncbi:MAG: response regulator [Herminiimonas sp.]|nr:response regulator [Herminiimonas sp.]